jgi:hypothetical protein
MTAIAVSVAQKQHVDPERVHHVSGKLFRDLAPVLRGLGLGIIADNLINTGRTSHDPHPSRRPKGLAVSSGIDQSPQTPLFLRREVVGTSLRVCSGTRVAQLRPRMSLGRCGVRRATTPQSLRYSFAKS